MGYLIDKGVPIPRIKGPRGGSKYPFATMEIGDSFMVRFTDEEVKGSSTHSIRARLIAAAWRISVHQKLGHKFVTRVVEGGVRVWREA